MPADNKFVMSNALSAAFTTLEPYIESLLERVRVLENVQVHAHTIHALAYQGRVVPGDNLNRECNAILNDLDAGYPIHVLLDIADPLDTRQPHTLLSLDRYETARLPRSMKMVFTKTVVLDTPVPSIYKVMPEVEYHIALTGDTWAFSTFLNNYSDE